MEIGLCKKCEAHTFIDTLTQLCNNCEPQVTERRNSWMIHKIKFYENPPNRWIDSETVGKDDNVVLADKINELIDIVNQLTKGSKSNEV